MYERNVNCTELTYLRRLILPSSNTKDISIELHKQQSNEIIQSLALSPNEETLLVGTNTNHLYEFAFSKIVILLFRKFNLIYSYRIILKNK